MTTGSTDGTFVRIGQGAYAHFPDQGFIVLRLDKSVQPYLDNPAKLKGSAILVYWKEQTIPEAGGKLTAIVKVESQTG